MTSSFTFRMKITSVFVLAVFLNSVLPGCTKQSVRAPVQEREIQVNWEGLKHTSFYSDGLELRSVVLAPAQYPLEASLKHLAQLDFVGVWKNFDLRLKPSNLPEGALKKLYDAGYLPVYARVYNPGTTTVLFYPGLLTVSGSSEPMLNVQPETLPRVFKELDIERTALNIGLVIVLILLLVAIAALGGGSGSGGNFGNVFGSSPSSTLDTANRETGVSARNESGILFSGEIPPQESREGFLFFKIPSGMVNWNDARLAKL